MGGEKNEEDKGIHVTNNKHYKAAEIFFII